MRKQQLTFDIQNVMSETSNQTWFALTQRTATEIPLPLKRAFRRVGMFSRAASLKPSILPTAHVTRDTTP
jgi:hypothetical protein